MVNCRPVCLCHKDCLWPWPLNPWPSNSQVSFLTIFGLTVTLTFDLLISNSNPFIRSHKQFIRYHVHKLLVYDQEQRDVQMDSLKTEYVGRIIASKGIKTTKPIRKQKYYLAWQMIVSVAGSLKIGRGNGRGATIGVYLPTRLHSVGERATETAQVITIKVISPADNLGTKIDLAPRLVLILGKPLLVKQVESRNDSWTPSDQALLVLYSTDPFSVVFSLQTVVDGLHLLQLLLLRLQTTVELGNRSSVHLYLPSLPNTHHA